MRIIGAAVLVTVCGILAGASAQAGTVPPVRGNDTGGIIAYPLAAQMDVRQVAVDHCAYYGKVVNGVDSNIVIGALRFPDDAAIGAVAAAAKEASSSGAFSLDAILFGKWQD